MYKFIRIGLRFDYQFYVSELLIKQGLLFGYTKHPIFLKNRLIVLLFKLFSSNRFVPFSNRFTKSFCCKQYLKGLRISKNDVVCFSILEISDRFINIDLPTFLKKNYPNSKVIYFFNDVISLHQRCIRNFDINYFKSIFDLLISFNELDVSNYNLILNRPRIINYPFESTIICYDVLFVGKEKGRLQKLLDIYDLLESNGYKCLFYIIDVDEKTAPKRANIIYNQAISYKENLELVSKSKCVLNLMQKGSSGITLRDYEAIGMNRILITNNRSFVNSRFYNSRKCIFDDELNDNFNKIDSFDEKEEWNGKKEYNEKNYYFWLSSLLNED